MAYIDDSKRELKVKRQHAYTNMCTYIPTLHTPPRALQAGVRKEERKGEEGGWGAQSGQGEMNKRAGLCPLARQEGISQIYKGHIGLGGKTKVKGHIGPAKKGEREGGGHDWAHVTPNQAVGDFGVV